MPSSDRMFHVIVAGGIALVALPTAAATGCGGAVSSTATGDDGGSQHDAAYRDAFPQEGFDAFPQEGPPPPPDSGSVDAGGDGSSQLDAGFDVFPHEGPNIEAGFYDTGSIDTGSIDTGTADAAGDGATDAASAPDGFPHETAVP